MTPPDAAATGVFATAQAMRDWIAVAQVVPPMFQLTVRQPETRGLVHHARLQGQTSAALSMGR